MIFNTRLEKAIKKGIKYTVLMFLCFLCICLSSCVMHSSELKVNFVNHSASRFFVGELYDCDSCGIKQAMKLYCSNQYDSTYFPKILMAGGSVIMSTKFLGKEKVFAINADSLDALCKSKYSHEVISKNWVKIFRNDKLDETNRTCTFLIK
jgi:hypothetical protein